MIRKLIGVFILFSSVCFLNTPHVYSRDYKLSSALDYFTVDGADKLFKNEADFLNSNFGGGSSVIDTNPGYGVRVGLMFPVKSVANLNVGCSLGYINGPTVTATSYSGPGLTPQSWIKTEGKTTYYRLLIEADKKLLVHKHFSFKLGAGVGLSYGSLDRKESYSGGWYLARDSNTKYNSTGFSWEVSPSIGWAFEKTNLILGMRYAQFADIKNISVETSAGKGRKNLEWSSFGAFVGIEF
jgi:hypothetical protein